MESFGWSSKKKNDKWGILVALSLIVIFLICKAIIDSGHVLFCIICLILGIVAYFIFEYIQKKRLEKPASLGVYLKKYPIIIQYTPPKGINPAEAGLLYNLSVEPTDLTSLIYQWKFEKLIDIKTFKGENSKKEYVKLIKKTDMPLTRPLFESEIFNSIFNMGDVKIIEGAFQLRYALMLEDLEFHGIQKGWIVKSSGGNKFNDLYNLLVTLFFMCIAVLTSGEVVVLLPYLFVISLILFLCCVFLGGYMYGGGKLKFTDKGAQLASYLIGYRNFIKSCDENKIKLLLKEDPLFIDRTLPYATAFGMETEFLKKVSPLKKDWNAKYVRGKKIPSWVGVLRIFMKDDDSLL